MKRFICFFMFIFLGGVFIASDIIDSDNLGDVFEPNANQVVFYEHSNYGGDFFAWNYDKDLRNFKGWFVGNSTKKTWNDQVSSIKVGKNACVTIWKDANFKGDKKNYSGNGSITKNIPSMPSGWNDKISSAKIRMKDNCAKE